MGDSKDPGFERTLLVIAIKVFESFEENFRREIFSNLVIEAHSIKDVVEDSCFMLFIISGEVDCMSYSRYMRGCLHKINTLKNTLDTIFCYKELRKKNRMRIISRPGDVFETFYESSILPHQKFASTICNGICNF